MSKFTISLWVALLWLFVSCGQTSPEQTPSKPAIITGKILNPDVYPDYRTVSVTVGDFRGSDIVYTDTIAEDGTFRLEVQLYTTQDIDFTPIARTLLARPGDSIFIDIDFRNIGKVKFSGDFAQANEHYHRYVNSNYHLDYYQQADFTADAKTFKLFCDSVKDVMRQKRNAFIEEVNPGQEVLRWISDYIVIQYAITLSRYVLNQLYLSRTSDLSWDFPEDYLGYFQELNTRFQPDVVYTRIYELAEMTFFLQGLRNDSIIKPEHEDYLRKLWDIVFHDYHGGYFSQLVLGSTFEHRMAMNNIGLIEDNREFFDEHLTEPSIRFPLLTQYENIKYLKENPEVKHASYMKDFEASPARTFLDSILESHHGKVVYIDIWTTWCGPCIASMPDANKMAEHFADQEVAFVFLCMGSEKGLWEKIIEENALTGYQWYAENREIGNGLMRGLKLRSFPLYLLVNRQGHITEKGSYLSPGSQDTYDKINALLAES